MHSNNQNDPKLCHFKKKIMIAELNAWSTTIQVESRTHKLTQFQWTVFLRCFISFLDPYALCSSRVVLNFRGKMFVSLLLMPPLLMFILSTVKNKICALNADKVKETVNFSL